MARTYKRDSRGRFASTGGGGSGGGGSSKKSSSAPKSKAAQTKAANDARTKELQAKGMTGAGSRLHSKIASKYSGSEKTREGRATRWTNVGEMKKNYASGVSAPPSKSPTRSGTISRRRTKK
jgi:hypothetical protein